MDYSAGEVHTPTKGATMRHLNDTTRQPDSLGAVDTMQVARMLMGMRIPARKDERHGHLDVAADGSRDRGLEAA